MKKLIGIVACVFLLGCPVPPGQHKITNESQQKLADEITQLEKEIGEAKVEVALRDQRDTLRKQLAGVLKIGQPEK
jgi:uncharacterized lipoprotein YajG